MTNANQDRSDTELQDDGEDRLMKLPEVMRMTALSRSEVYRRVAARQFPTPVRLGSQAIAWRLSDIRNWIASLPPARC